MKQINLVVLFGGQSSEHEVSCVSATTVIESIDSNHYKVIPVGITKEGKWLLYEGKDLSQLKSGQWINQSKPAFISPDASEKALYIIEKNSYKKETIDIVFPVLHGLNGEDGTIQGLLELAKIPYVGCGVFTSSASMDKHYTKIVVDQLGIHQAKHVTVSKNDLNEMNNIIKEIEEKLSYPMFVKPSNAGSSVGISKAKNRGELIDGLGKATIHDRKIIVEEGIIGREIECAVLGGISPKASGVGEVVAAAEFYDYDAKYNNNESKTIINPDLPKEVVDEIKKSAIKIFNALDGYGLSRVDFFVENDTNRVVFNEINTMPGFTSISMYPMLWEDKGISKKELIDKLIQLGIKRYN